jgi:hypothetical protein
MSVKYIQYKGKTILYVDYSNTTGDQAITTLHAEEKEVRSWKEPGLVLNDFRNSKATSEFMAEAKKLGKELFSKMEKKTAAIGITGIQSILLKAYNTFASDKIVPFETEEEAKEWLIKD